MHAWIARLASLKLTLFILIALGAGILMSYAEWMSGTWALAVPLALFALNLMAAVASKPAFRRQKALLIFHLGLIAIVLLLVAGRLTYLKGSVELSEGEEFDGQLTSFEAGPWHWWNLGRVHFSNEGFRIAYAPGVVRDKTRNMVRYADAEGREQHAEIGDQQPLVLSGYRFYTSPNKGFAPTFFWQPASGGPASLGTVHLPSYPLNEYKQAREWQLPGTGIRVWTMLQFDEVILKQDGPSEFRLPREHKVVVHIGDLRRELQPGDAIELPQGRLVYDGLRTWMGYAVFYDWTIHWMLVVCMITVAALGWHLWRKFSARPWDA
ncbi:cytochrome c biogenesis protein ResB [Noviherbaspirillum sp. UKPF54]|uniref:cytochrome c biogenesis protein ResB n=1 Tax=Noviherbaspirillum sp. UKPF54 TaxID=2601898 RepID=UPI0011B1977A|nr:cytochrome c biogenesis protein ResB [Noviherbaspirillum sp. UKPF54]QDZ27721.1 cytochrome c biogenesis protein ResB [Noviherbaspirillum sp. UKPF54]